jgi:hypothetical protein
MRVMMSFSQRWLSLLVRFIWESISKRQSNDFGGPFDRDRPCGSKWRSLRQRPALRVRMAVPSTETGLGGKNGGPFRRDRPYCLQMAVPSAETGFYSVGTAVPGAEAGIASSMAVPGAEAGIASSMAVPDEETGKLICVAGPRRRDWQFALYGRSQMKRPAFARNGIHLKKLYKNTKAMKLIDLPWLILVRLQKILGF